MLAELFIGDNVEKLPLHLRTIIQWHEKRLCLEFDVNFIKLPKVFEHIDLIVKCEGFLRIITDKLN